MRLKTHAMNLNTASYLLLKLTNLCGMLTLWNILVL